MDDTAATAAAVWFLEVSPHGGKKSWRVPLRTFPFRIGRGSGLDLSLSADSISKRHAEIERQGDRLVLRDLASTNGTFVNGQRIDQPVPVGAGDLIHFATLECRLGRGRRRVDSRTEETLFVDLGSAAEEIAAGTALPELLAGRQAICHFQPILDLSDGSLLGFEALGRGTHPKLSPGPSRLLELASALGVEPELSRLFRRTAMAAAPGLPDGSLLFVNTIAGELADPTSLLADIEKLAERMTPGRLVVEVHERAVGDLDSIGALREELRGRGVALAYDDFGAGESRLLELAEVPPDYVKFDGRWTAGLAEASSPRRQVLGSLVALARDLGAAPLAEGLERESDAAVCRDLGFAYGQGFLFGRPAPLGG